MQQSRLQEHQTIRLSAALAVDVRGRPFVVSVRPWNSGLSGGEKGLEARPKFGAPGPKLGAPGPKLGAPGPLGSHAFKNTRLSACLRRWRWTSAAGPSW